MWRIYLIQKNPPGKFRADPYAVGIGFNIAAVTIRAVPKGSIDPCHGFVTNQLSALPTYQESMFLNSSMYLPAGTSQLKSISISFFCRAWKASRLLLYRSRQRFREA